MQGSIESLDGLDSSEHSFEEIPLALGHQLLTEHQLFQFDALSNRLGLRFEIPQDQRFISSFQDHGSYGSLVSNSQLYLLEPKDPEDRLSPLVTLAKIPLPKGPDYLAGIEIAELLDGYLMSFLYGHFEDRGFSPMEQVVVELGPSGELETLANRPLIHGHPDEYIYRSFIVSPAIGTLSDLLWSAVAPRKWNRVSPKSLLTRPLPQPVLLAALWVALLSALSAYWIGGRRVLTPVRRRIWTAAVFLTGIPGLLSFLFLTSTRERLRPKAIVPSLLEVSAS